jgi:hypothetical protein
MQSPLRGPVAKTSTARDRMGHPFRLVPQHAGAKEIIDPYD